MTDLRGAGSRSCRLKQGRRAELLPRRVISSSCPRSWPGGAGGCKALPRPRAPKSPRRPGGEQRQQPPPSTRGPWRPRGAALLPSDSSPPAPRGQMGGGAGGAEGQGRGQSTTPDSREGRLASRRWGLDQALRAAPKSIQQPQLQPQKGALRQTRPSPPQPWQVQHLCPHAQVPSKATADRRAPATWPGPNPGPASDIPEPQLLAN